MEVNLIKDMAIGILAIFNLLLIVVIRSEFSSKQKSNQDPVDIQQNHCRSGQYPVAKDAQHSDAEKINNEDSRRAGRSQIDGHVL
jgi:hypothetical protein